MRSPAAVVADLVVAALVALVTIEHVASPSSTSMRAPAAVAARTWWSRSRFRSLLSPLQRGFRGRKPLLQISKLFVKYRE